MGLLFSEAVLLIALYDVVNVLFEVLDVVGMLIASILQMLDISVHFVFSLLCHECLSHSVGDGTFIEGLVSLDGHFNLISDSDKEESSLGTLNSDLTDQFVEALSEEFFTDGADPGFSRLSALEQLVQFVLQIDNVDLGSRGWRYVTDPQLA